MSTDEDPSENAKSIKPINVDTVHKICSGQVVLNLAIAVKELVENSLDAGATNVEVRFKNYGIDLIEVSDNGSGVTEDNFAALTLKYHTSKLNDYSDLLGVSSFGFRGEALSSLCALADLTITTRHRSCEYATRLEYDHKGNLVKKTPCSRQVGTTVTLSNLFSSLPVRQKEFHKNAKREFNKMTQLLYAYCLISIGVKINCTNQTSSNTKSVVVATQGSQNYKDNIACVFGAKQLYSILDLKPKFTPNIKDNLLKGLSQEVNETDSSVNIEDVEIDLSEDSTDAENKDDTLTQESTCSQVSTKSQGYKNDVCPVDFTGFISSCAHGSGRSSTDRQFYFVNSRPCEPPKITKLVNEVYRQYNPHQYPFVFLNINLDRSSIDVNVTPDKRKVFLTKEKIILDVVKCSMMKLFESIPRTLKVESSQNLFGREIKEDLKPDLDQPRIFNSFLQRFASNTAKNNQSSDTTTKSKHTELKRKSTLMLDFVCKKSMKYGNSESDEEIEEVKSIKPDQVNNNKIEIKLSNCDLLNNHEEIKRIKPKAVDTSNTTITKISDGSIDVNNKIEIKVSNCDLLNNHEEIEVIKPVAVDTSNTSITKTFSTDGEMKVDNIKLPERKANDSIKLNDDIMFLESTDHMPDTQIRTIDDIVETSRTTKFKTKSLVHLSPNKGHSPTINAKTIVTDKEDLGKYNRKIVNLKTSLKHVQALAEIYNKQHSKEAPEKIKFRSAINPVFNKNCEEELSREISKESFKKMTVVGQFNLGFIITRLEDDLFIIDQHATDEIYNFETLQKTTELTNQKLVIPQQLELTGVNEQILMENLEVFKKNGFTFQINEEALPTKRVKLLTIPMSKNWVFGKDDIEELLFMLRESPSEHCRPSRVRAMFASRACRKSVMIGTALANNDMKTLVDHMAEIDKPWSCPHGRPTIRHLVNLAMVHTKDD